MCKTPQEYRTKRGLPEPLQNRRRKKYLETLLEEQKYKNSPNINLEKLITKKLEPYHKNIETIYKKIVKNQGPIWIKPPITHQGQINKKCGYRKNREYESPLHQYRVGQQLTVCALAHKAGTTQITISSLANGTMSPFYVIANKAGQLRPYITKMCEILHTTPEELFPRYFCRIIPSEPTNIQVLEMSQSVYSILNSKSPESLNITHETKTYLKNTFQRLSPREQNILIARIFEGQTLKKIGNQYEISRERVRQIEKKALNRLRHTIIKDRYLSYGLGPGP